MDNQQRLGEHMTTRDLSALDVKQHVSVFDALGAAASEFKDDVIAELAKRLFVEYPTGFDVNLCPDEEEKARDRAEWLTVYERVKDTDPFFDQRDRAFAAWAAGTGLSIEPPARPKKSNQKSV
jgi:hypothetical protein